MPNDNLTSALRASLSLVEDNPTSPLSEATPDSVDELLDRINSAMAEGLPEKITDETLRKVIDLYRAQAYRFQQDEENKPRRAAPGTKTPKPKPLAEIIDLDL